MLVPLRASPMMNTGRAAFISWEICRSRFSPKTSCRPLCACGCPDRGASPPRGKLPDVGELASPGDFTCSIPCLLSGDVDAEGDQKNPRRDQSQERWVRQDGILRRGSAALLEEQT